jgi:hypothetical protein
MESLVEGYPALLGFAGSVMGKKLEEAAGLNLTNRCYVKLLICLETLTLQSKLNGG